ncbi:Uncharacterised protein [uncultured Clostridium sp.]|jgi:hypothetical protein|nr:Uncharacterised protein [uncultured Clostridium sp.]
MTGKVCYSMNKSKRPRCRKQSVNNTKQITKICENEEETNCENCNSNRFI